MVLPNIILWRCDNLSCCLFFKNNLNICSQVCPSQLWTKIHSTWNSDGWDLPTTRDTQKNASNSAHIFKYKLTCKRHFNTFQPNCIPSIIVSPDLIPNKLSVLQIEKIMLNAQFWRRFPAWNSLMAASSSAFIASCQAQPKEDAWTANPCGKPNIVTAMHIKNDCQWRYDQHVVKPNATHLQFGMVYTTHKNGKPLLFRSWLPVRCGWNMMKSPQHFGELLPFFCDGKVPLK